MGAELPSDSMPVHVLLCEAHVGFGIPCLQSALKNTRDAFRLIIHSDGSLSPSSTDRLREEIPGAAVIPRSEADEQLAERLVHFPAIRAARTRLPYVMKLFDINLLSNDDGLVRYLDSDVFFFRPFHGLFPGRTVPEHQAVFSCDYANSYGARVTDFWPVGPLILVKKLNSGLFWVRANLIDYDRMEWLFERWGPARIEEYRGWFEQTVWADFAWRVRSQMYHDGQIRTASANHGAVSDEVGIHFVGPARHHLVRLLETSAVFTRTAPDPVSIQTVAARPYTLANALVASARVRWNRRKRRKP